jgi:preprotein translocase subunit SecG
MYNFLVFVELVISVVLTAVILLQSSKGTGLSGSLGGSAMGTVFGVRRTSDFLTKGTTILAASLMVLCLIINMFFLGNSAGVAESILQSRKTTSMPAPSSPQTRPATSTQQQTKK